MAESSETQTAGKTPEQETQEFVNNLKHDRLIKVFIGSESEAVFVAQSTLSAASDYFDRAIKNSSRMGNGEDGVLRFPQDELAPWGMLLYYIHKLSLPESKTESETGQVILVKAWILGDKYLMPDFQDLVMLELLRAWDAHIITLPVVEAAFDGTAYDSKLREIVADELVHAVYYADAYKMTQLSFLDGIDGSSATVAAAVRRAHERCEPGEDFAALSNRFDGEAAGLDGEGCKQSLLGDGPRKHWAVKYTEERRAAGGE